MGKSFKKTIRVLAKHYRDKSYLQWYFRHSKRLDKFKDAHKGKSCFIIGNGPSLNLIDLTKLNNLYTFGMNKIYLIFDRVDLKISYYVSVNPLVVKQSARSIENMKCPSFISYRPGRKHIKQLDHIYFIMTLWRGKKIFFKPDLTRTINEGYTVTYVAMQIAYFMGFSNIFLIGVDHNFTSKGVPDEKQFLNDKDLNHFDTRYFQNCEWNLPNLEGSEIAYRMAKKQFEIDGRKIYDATVNGKLQIFDKISYEEALERCGKMNTNQK